MEVKNKKIRDKMRIADLKHYQVAEKIGISHITIMNWLRVGLTKERKEKILRAIRELESKNGK